MLCTFCAKEGISEVYTDYIRNFKDKKVIVKNVPALYCDTCGEYYFKNNTIKNIRDYILQMIDDNNEYIILKDYNDILVSTVS